MEEPIAKNLHTLAKLAEERLYITELYWVSKPDGTMQLALVDYTDAEVKKLVHSLAEHHINARPEVLEHTPFKSLVVDQQSANLIREMFLELELAHLDKQLEQNSNDKSLLDLIERQEGKLKQLRTARDADAAKNSHAEHVSRLSNLASDRVYLSLLQWKFPQDEIAQLSLEGYDEYETKRLVRALADQGIVAEPQLNTGENYKTLVTKGKSADLVLEMYIEQKLALADAEFQANPKGVDFWQVEKQEIALNTVRKALTNRDIVQQRNGAVESSKQDSLPANASAQNVGWLSNSRTANSIAQGAEFGAKSLAVAGVGYVAYNTTTQARNLVIADKSLEAANLVGENSSRLIAGFAAAMPAIQASTKLIPGPVGKVSGIASGVVAGYLANKLVDAELSLLEYLSTQMNQQAAALKKTTLDTLMEQNLLANGVPKEKVAMVMQQIHLIKDAQELNHPAETSLTR